MSVENIVDKVKLISELKDTHSELFQVYKKLFDFKYNHDEKFRLFIDNEYKENGISSKQTKEWNDNFCHRASYTLLNKILFVRICEDKGFMRNAEDYIAGEVKDPHIGEKLSKIGLQKWGALVTNYTLGELIKFAFNDMKKSYSNIVLYKEDKYEILNPKDEEFNLKYIDGDKNTKDLILEFEKVLNNIIEKLDTNNFNFKYTDGNILGDVYEKFMDKETRKALGQFYTPEFVIKYILKNTVAEADVVENPFVTVADISCGSGHFLIMAYDILREKFLANLDRLKEKYVDKIYTIKKDGEEIQLTGKEYWVKEHLHYHILKHCIYGADIDSFAVQLTTINLLLKDLDNIIDEINIIQCDSLIQWEKDYNWYDLKEQLEKEFETVVTTQTNLFGDEEKSAQVMRKQSYELKYKNISGVQIEEVINREKAEEILKVCEFWSNKFDYIVGNPPYIGFGNKIDKKYIENKYECFMGKSDIFIAFIELAYDKLKLKGDCGFIFPVTFLNHPNNENIRKRIIKDTKIKNIVNLGEKIFEDVKKNTMLLIFKKERIDENYLCTTQDISTIKGINDKKSNLFSNNGCKKVHQSIFQQMPLMILDTFLEESLIILFLDIYKNNSKVSDIGKALDAGIDYNKKSVSKKVFYKGEKSNTNDHEILSGKNINKFVTYSTDKYLLENYKENIQKGEYIKVNEDVYELESKIIYRQTADRIIATIDEGRRYFDKSVHAIKIDEVMIDNKYIVCLLNSSLFKFFYDIFAGGEIRCHSDFPQVKTIFIDNLPIKLDVSKGTSKLIDQLINKIMEQQNNLINLKLQDFYISSYIKFEENKLDIELNILYLSIILDLIVYDIYEVDCSLRLKILKSIDKEESEKMVEDILKRENLKINYDNLFESLKKSVDCQIKESIGEVMKIITPEKLIQEHIYNEKDICKIAQEYGVNSTILKLIRKKYSQQQFCNYPSKFYSLKELCDVINNYLRKIIITELKKKRSVNELEDISSFLESNNEKFTLLMDVYRQYKETIKTKDVIKETLNLDAYTWNAYRKDKVKGKVNKTFVKYYDKNYYGLSEWSDEIHKQYFMDAIDEYTVNNPNEKKAKDISKLFLDLDIEDKEDYIDIIEDKIKRAFY